MKATALILAFMLAFMVYAGTKVQTLLADVTQPQLEQETQVDIRDNCTWKGCTHESDLIFMGAGLCDEHHSLAGSTYKSTYDYAVDRVIPEAAEAMREQQASNEAKNKD